MPHTGQRAQKSGIYGNDCHRKQIALSVGETFPPLLWLPPCSQLAANPRLSNDSVTPPPRRELATSPGRACLRTPSWRQAAGRSVRHLEDVRKPAEWSETGRQPADERACDRAFWLSQPLFRQAL
jgi:hypothetical protein